MPQWYERSTPDAITAKPWLGYDAIAYLEAILTSDMRVLEHGAGGSTLWFAQRVKEVVSVEHDLDWLDALSSRRPDNVTLVLEQENILPALLAPFDLMLVDGDPVVNRALYIQAAQKLVKPGGWVVVDNYNRPEYAKEMQELLKLDKDYKTFDFNTGGSKYFCTCFLRMPQ